MDVIEILIGILFIVIGYFIGSINPGYLFGKLKGVDIRKEGTCNAGTANVFRVLGPYYAIPTAIFDTLKGVGMIFLASTIGVNYIFAHFSGIAAIFGHVFPFYMQFRGGQGMATSTGILIFYLIYYIFTGLGIFLIIGYIIILIVIFFYVTKRGTILGVLVLPFLGYSIFIIYPNSPYNLFFLILVLYMCTVAMYLIIRDKKIVIEDESFKAHWWRVAIRPVSLLFLVFYFIYSTQVCLFVIGIVVICFVFLDIFRFLHKKTNILLTERIKSIFRKGEEKKFSTMTIFLISFFITVLVFDIEIAITALIFLVFGDMFSKVFGLAYGRHKIFEKTLEGTLAFIGSVIIFGFVLYTSLDIAFIILLVGGIAAPLIEILPLGVNDNFTVPILSGVTMFATQFFFL
jgi:glycerol-3-phosphate acyltransferase PlsY